MQSGTGEHRNGTGNHRRSKHSQKEEPETNLEQRRHVLTNSQFLIFPPHLEMFTSKKWNVCRDSNSQTKHGGNKAWERLDHPGECS